MEPLVIQNMGVIQSELGELILFTATLSLGIWAVVVLTTVLRFGARLRYRRALSDHVDRDQDTEGTQQP